MTRPRKMTVDYFPHTCKHGKTMFIIEQRYGNDGYAFWFKLLELLGDSEGHYIDCNDPMTWEFLQSITRSSSDFCFEILELLSKLGAIDSELWQQKVIWSDNFIKGIAEVYKNRRVEIPKRPDNYNRKSGYDEISTLSEGISTAENPQSKVEESRGEESKGKKSTVVLGAPPINQKSTSQNEPAKAAPQDKPADAQQQPDSAFECQFFSISEEYLSELLKDYPVANHDWLILQFKKIRDYQLDNPGHWKCNIKGLFKNPKNIIRRWIENSRDHPQNLPQACQPPPIRPDPDCPLCQGKGFVDANDNGQRVGLKKCSCWGNYGSKSKGDSNLPTTAAIV